MYGSLTRAFFRFGPDLAADTFSVLTHLSGMSSSLRGVAWPATLPPWLTIARSLIGRDISPPLIAKCISKVFPDMADYCRQVNTVDPYCGLFLAHCLSQFGYRPPFKAGSIQRGFLRSYAWSTWGKPSWRLPGDVLVLDMGGFHHVTFYVDDNRDGTWLTLGASQGPEHITGLWNYKADLCVAARRPKGL